MRIEIPREFERLGAVLFYGLQKVYELDSGMMSGETAESPPQSVIQRVPHEALTAVERQMAIIVPVRNERLKLIQGVLCGIPHDCLTVVVSNSPRLPIDRFAIERDAIMNFSKFVDKKVIVVHQKDPAIGEAFRRGGYTKLLDRRGLIRDGKAEGMLAGLMLAKLAGKKYVGFVDADNYFPGAVLEYVHEYAAGFATSRSHYAMVRISWHSKPKIVESSLFFPRWGRTSVVTNRFFNSLITHHTGFETEVIKTGNAGEHALTTDLAMLMEYAAGYAVEPHHLIDLLEQFGGIAEALNSDVLQQHIEVYQIESRNPHLHEVKGDDHVDDMIAASLAVIYHSPLCPDPLRQEILAELRERGLLAEGRRPKRPTYYPPLACIDLKAFAAALDDHPIAAMLSL